MITFGFIVHPINLNNVYNFFPPSRIVPPFLINQILTHLPPFKLNHIKGIRSKTGKEIEGYFILCPLLSKQILELDEDFVINKVLQAGRIAEKLKVNMLGIGALAGTVGEGARKIADSLDVPITNGTTYAGCAVIESILKAAEIRNINLANSKVAIIGATNSIGKICAYTLSPRVALISLVARNQERLSDFVDKLKNNGHKNIEHAGIGVVGALGCADIVIFTTTAVEVSPKIKIENLKQGAIICDIPVPRNITLDIVKMRPDLLTIDGAAIEPPFNIRLNMETGLSPNQIYACMAETMILTFEGKFEDFSFGYEPSLKKVEEISTLANKHGFKPAFTSFGKKII